MSIRVNHIVFLQQHEPAPLALMQFIRRHRISLPAARFLLKDATVKTYARAKHLVRGSEQCQVYFFICQGLVRCYRKDGERKITGWFGKENELVTLLPDILRNRATGEYLQALEKTTVVAIPAATMKAAFKKFPALQQKARHIEEKFLICAIEKGFICGLSAEQRYHWMLQNHRTYITRIPLNIIASYLGLTLETLSRVRRKYKKIA